MTQRTPPKQGTLLSYGWLGMLYLALSRPVNDPLRRIKERYPSYDQDYCRRQSRAV
jgi:hypothetical protein